MDELIAAHGPSGDPVRECRNPVFIVGSPRSGTSVLAWSLAEHTHLWTSGESDVLYELYGPKHVRDVYARAFARPHGWFRSQNVDQTEFLRCLGAGLSMLFASRSGTRRWIDQTPLYTLMVDVLAEMFPTAQFLNIVRDGREVVQSMLNFHRLFEKDGKLDWPEGNFVPLWITDFRNACETWVEHVTVGTQFAENHPERCLTVLYRDLVTKPQQTFEAIQAFLQVPYETGPLEYLTTHRINSSFGSSKETSNAPERPSSPWDAWNFEQKQVFVHKSGHTLVDYDLVSDEEMQHMEAETGAGRHDDVSARSDLARTVRDVVARVVPTGAVVLVVSKGDETLLELSGWRAWHFPRGADGRYAGYYPSNDEEAIGHLERLRVKGAQYIVFPVSSLWWLDHYRAFREYLEQQYHLVASAGTCIVFSLQPSGVNATQREIGVAVHEEV